MLEVRVSHPYLIEEVFKHEVVVIVTGSELHVLQRESEVQAQMIHTREQSQKALLSEFVLNGVNILPMKVVAVGVEEFYLVDKVVHQQVMLYNSGL